MWLLKKLYNLAFYHKETGLPNRKRLEKELNKINRYKTLDNNIGLISFSVKNFHEISDLFKKEEIYTKAKKIFADSGRVIYRLNKNEYALVVIGKSQEETYEEVIKIMKKHSQHYIGSIGIKLGFGMSHLSTSRSIERIIKNTLYSLHLSLRENRVIIGTPQFLEEYRATKKLEYELENALKKERYLPFFQPKIGVVKGDLRGAEVLARYVDYRGIYISPGVFIPLLEENNLIKKLDLQLLDKALIITKKWMEEGIVCKNFIISQNLSIKTLESEEILQKIREIIIKRNFPVENLEFEVTETALSSDLDLVIKNLSEIKSLGVSVSIDDFSAGNSSVDYITKFPIDTIKLDMSILPVSKEETSKIDIYTSFINTFNKLGYKIVSEGVEDPWQDEFLKKLKVDEAQGYLYSKPIGKEEFEKFTKKISL